MKKLLLFLLPFLLLAGCGDNNSLGEKECIDYRNDYMQYVMNKYGFISEKDYDWVSTKNILWSFEMFYSKPFKKCIAAYAYDLYEPTRNGLDVVTRTFYIDDAFEWDFLEYNTCYFYSDEWCADDYDRFHNWREYYRTWKWEPRNN